VKAIVSAVQEKVVNRLQRQLEGLLANYHILEQARHLGCDVAAHALQVSVSDVVSLLPLDMQRLEMAGVPVQQLPVRCC
jgi:uncharacterized protein YaaW (UPF0174 family)